MNEPTYAVNREGAIRASGTPRIHAKGAYVGTFTRAEYVKSRADTVGIEFTFVSDEGALADYLTVWTMNRDGKELSGRALVDALMTCMAVRELKPKPGHVDKYSREAGGRESLPATLYPDLMGKKIGVLLIVEEYVGNDGGVKSKLAMVNCFEPASGKTAREIWEKSPAQALPALTAGLRDKLLAPPPQQVRRAEPENFDDIPF